MAGSPGMGGRPGSVGVGEAPASGVGSNGPVAGLPPCAAESGAKLPITPSTPPKRPPSGVPVSQLESSLRPVMSTVMNRFM